MILKNKFFINKWNNIFISRKQKKESFELEMIFPDGKKLFFQNIKMQILSKDIKVPYFHGKNAISVANNAIFSIFNDKDIELLFACSQIFVHSDDKKIVVNTLKEVFPLTFSKNKEDKLMIENKFKEIKEKWKAYSLKHEIGLFATEISDFNEIVEQKNFYESLKKYKLKIKDDYEVKKQN